MNSMRLDMDLIRSLMLQLVDDPPPGVNYSCEYDAMYHRWLLVGAELAEGERSPRPEPDADLKWATMKGQDFVALARSRERWDRVKERIEKAVETAPLEIWMELLKDEVRKDIGRGWASVESVRAKESQTE